MIFFFNDTATTEIYTLSLHDALPIFKGRDWSEVKVFFPHLSLSLLGSGGVWPGSTLHLSGSPPLQLHFSRRSEEHTSELQSRQYLVCRLLLEKKTTIQNTLKLILLLF